MCRVWGQRSMHSSGRCLSHLLSQWRGVSKEAPHDLKTVCAALEMLPRWEAVTANSHSSDLVPSCGQMQRPIPDPKRLPGCMQC